MSAEILRHNFSHEDISAKAHELWQQYQVWGKSDYFWTMAILALSDQADAVAIRHVGARMMQRGFDILSESWDTISYIRVYIGKLNSEYDIPEPHRSAEFAKIHMLSGTLGPARVRMVEVLYHIVKLTGYTYDIVQYSLSSPTLVDDIIRDSLAILDKYPRSNESMVDSETRTIVGSNRAWKKPI